MHSFASNKHTTYLYDGCVVSNLKNLVWHSHNFLLPYITVEEHFIICFTFIFNLYFQWFVVDELPAFIVTVNNFLT